MTKGKKKRNGEPKIYETKKKTNSKMVNLK